MTATTQIHVHEGFLDVLQDGLGRKVAILGDMGELERMKLHFMKV